MFKEHEKYIEIIGSHYVIFELQVYLILMMIQ